MKNLAVLAILAFCPLSQAQTKPDIQLPPNVRLYEPKNLTPDKAPRLATSIQHLLNGMGPYWDDVLHAFVLHGNPQDMDLQEALLKRYDVAEPRVELTVYLIRAATTAAAPADPRIQAGPPIPVPAELKAAIDAMNGAFKYDHYSLWDTIVVPLQGNGGEVKGLLPEFGPLRTYYSIAYSAFSRTPASEAATYNLAGFVFSLNTQPSKDGNESRIETALGIHENEKLVLGKIRLLGGTDLFLVLTARIH